MPPAVMALSAAGIVPAPRHGIGAYFKSIPLWNDPRLLRDDAAAAGLADLLGDAPALVMRGNGAVVVGEGLPQAVTLAWFLEDAARVERSVRAMGLDVARKRTRLNSSHQCAPRMPSSARTTPMQDKT